MWLPDQKRIEPARRTRTLLLARFDPFGQNEHLA